MASIYLQLPYTTSTAWFYITLSIYSTRTNIKYHGLFFLEIEVKEMEVVINFFSSFHYGKQPPFLRETTLSMWRFGYSKLVLRACTLVTLNWIWVTQMAISGYSPRPWESLLHCQLSLFVIIKEKNHLSFLYLDLGKKEYENIEYFC